MGIILIFSIPFHFIEERTGETVSDLTAYNPILFFGILALISLLIHSIAVIALGNENAKDAFTDYPGFKTVYLVVLFILGLLYTDMIFNEPPMTNPILRNCLLAILVLCDIIHMAIVYSVKHHSIVKAVIDLIETQLGTVVMIMFLFFFLSIALPCLLLPFVIFLG